MGSYSTSINVRSSSAVSRASAATAATYSPTKRALSCATGGTPNRYLPTRMPFTSWPVTTALTPGSPCAREVSIRSIAVRGKGVTRRKKPYLQL